MADETPVSDVFVPPSVQEHLPALSAGDSYTHYSAVPANITLTTASTPGTPCVLGVDEAGRGPVIGPMVYGVAYLPLPLERPLLTTTHRFDDSKILTPAFRAALTHTLCRPATDLHANVGWAVTSLSARDIGAGMLRQGGSYNLNAQAMDATVALIRGVLDRGVNVAEVYVDTIGAPAVYQRKLERVFPGVAVTVAKKADSLYPCVSAASVVAKVTRDVSCEVMYREYIRQKVEEDGGEEDTEADWGSGYPSDTKCGSWLKRVMDPVFGWGNECRFSWGTVKDMLEAKGQQAKRADWPADDDGENTRVSQYFSAGAAGAKTESDELRDWFGTSVGQEAF